MMLIEAFVWAVVHNSAVARCGENVVVGFPQFTVRADNSQFATCRKVVGQNHRSLIAAYKVGNEPRHLLNLLW